MSGAWKRTLRSGRGPRVAERTPAPLPGIRLGLAPAPALMAWNIRLDVGVRSMSAAIRQHPNGELDMRRFILATASALALGITGAAVTHAADMNNTRPAPESAMSGAYLPQSAENLSKNDIQWAQRQLRSEGLYKGPINGVLTLQTQHALEQYQKKNGLTVTSSLDQPTMRSLHATHGLSGSSNLARSLPPRPDRSTGSMANPPLASPDRPYPGGEGD